MRDSAFVIAARGWSLELRQEHTFGDLHAALAAVFGWELDEDYAFALTGGPAPSFEDPDAVVDRSEAPITPLWFYLGPRGTRFWLVGGAARERRNRLELAARRRAYARLAYPRVVRAARGRGAPPVARDVTEAALALRGTARRWSETMAEIADVLEAAASGEAVKSSAWDAAAVSTREFLAWCTGGHARQRFDIIADRVGDQLSELLEHVLIPELARRRRFEAGLAVAEALLCAAPSAELMALVAILLKDLGRSEEALETYSQIPERFPSSGTARIIVARLLLEAGRGDDAELLLRSVIDDSEDDEVRERAVEHLSRILEQRGANDEAARLREGSAFARGVVRAGDQSSPGGRWPGRSGEMAEPRIHERAAPVRSAPAPGRNDPCPCGSGVKFKKCCGAPVPMSGPAQLALSQVVAAVVEFAQRAEADEARQDAIAEWFGEESGFVDLGAVIDHFPGATAGTAALEGLLFDARGRDGLTLADRFAAGRAARLAETDRRVLDRLRASALSLYQVTAVEPGKGFAAIDLVRGGQVAVRELSGSRDLTRWDLLALRLVELDGTTQMCGGLLVFSVTRKDEVLGRLRSAREEHATLFPGASADEALKDAGDELLEAYMAPPANPPQLATTDGEPLLLSRARFRLANPAAAARALAAPPLEEVEPGREFRWSEPREGPMENVTLGRITITEHSLIIECFSKERLARARDLVISRLGAGVQHVADEFMDPERLLAEPAREPRSPEDELPPEVVAEIEQAFKDKHYRAWIDQPVPALGGKTPRAAAATASGRVRVAQLLREFENAEDRAGTSTARAGRTPYDFGWLWQDLGIGREEGL